MPGVPRAPGWLAPSPGARLLSHNASATPSCSSTAASASPTSAGNLLAAVAGARGILAARRPRPRHAAYGTGALLSAVSPGLGVLILGNSVLEGVGTALLIPPVATTPATSSPAC